MRKYYKNYVCPQCFEQLSKCKCDNYPQRLLHIDLNIQKIIRDLNKKGYKTLGCCEGHFEKHDAEFYVIMNYDLEKDFSELPIGFKKYRRLPTSAYKIYHMYEHTENKDVFEKEKKECIDSFNNWLETLKDYDGNFVY